MLQEATVAGAVWRVKSGETQANMQVHMHMALSDATQRWCRHAWLAQQPERFEWGALAFALALSHDSSTQGGSA